MLRTSALLSMVCLLGCKSDETIARDELARQYACARSQITVTARKDLSAVDLMYRRPGDAPNEIVVVDPAKLAAEREEAEKEYAEARVMQARGCDREVFYVCATWGSGIHGCVSARYPPKP